MPLFCLPFFPVCPALVVGLKRGERKRCETQRVVGKLFLKCTRSGYACIEIVK